MERSIATLKVNTIKNETRTKNDIKKRTKENTQLLVELNSIKLEEKKLKNDILKKDKEIKEFEEELTKMRKQGEETSQMEQTKDLEDIDEDDTGAQGIGSSGQIPSLLKGNQRASSAAKRDQTSTLGKLNLGKGVTPFMKKKENLEDKARILDLTVI